MAGKMRKKKPAAPKFSTMYPLTSFLQRTSHRISFSGNNINDCDLKVSDSDAASVVLHYRLYSVQYVGAQECDRRHENRP
jgi:hypothetical protein